MSAVRSPELRHEVPLAIPDPFVYAELDGRRIAVVSAMEAMRLEGMGGLDVRPTEDFGADANRRSGLEPHEAARQLTVQTVQGLGIKRATVPHGFPLGFADALREAGIELNVDQKLFDDRRRRKTGPELAGIRRAQRAAEAGVATARDLLARAERSNGGLSVDGKQLTCELLKEHIQATFLEHISDCKCDPPHVVPAHARPGIEVHAQLVGVIKVIGKYRVRVQL